MSQIFDIYKTLHPKQKPNAVLALQVGDQYWFFEEDARKVSEVLQEEMTSYRISRGNNVNLFEIPNSRAKEVFAQLAEENYAVTVAPIPETDEPKKEETAEQVVLSGPQAVCSRCGKPLYTSKSVSQGMGDICAGHARILGSVSFEEHYRGLSLPELPPDWIPLAEWFAYGKSVGITAHRLMQAAGGDRAIRKPLHPSFQIMYYKHHRYVHRSALEFIEEARLK